MPIRTHAQEDEVEDGEPSRILGCEFAYELLLVCICELFYVVEQACINGVYILFGNGDLGEQFLRACCMIRVWVIEGNDTFIDIEDVPTWANEDAKWSMT